MQIHSLRANTLPVTRQLEIAGCRCALYTDSVSVLASLGSRWQAYDTPIQRDFDIWIHVDPDCQRKTLPPEFRGMRQYVFALFHGCDFFAFDLLDRRISAVVSEDTARNPAFWTTVLVPIALGVLGPTMGVAPLHCACLSSGKRGMLIVGLSGAGKSTLAVALAKEGLSLISDDWTYARLTTGEPAMYGLGVPVKLMPDTARFFKELRTHTLTTSLNGELAFEVDPQRTFSVRTSNECIPECIVFLQRVPGENAIAPLDRATALQFFEQSAEPLPPELRCADEERHRIIRAVTNRDCWLLSYAGLPQEGASMLRKFFEETYDGDACRASAS